MTAETTFDATSDTPANLHRSDGLLRPGETAVTIEQVMAVVTDDARTAHLVHWYGEPRVLLLNTVAEIGVGGATAGVGVPRPWKTPVDAPRPRAYPHEIEAGTTARPRRSRPERTTSDRGAPPPVAGGRRTDTTGLTIPDRSAVEMDGAGDPVRHEGAP